MVGGPSSLLLRAMGKKKQYFTTGQGILETGIYRVIHKKHRLPSEVTLLAGQQFPRCGKCAERVVFELLQAAPDAYAPRDFRINLYELPELTYPSGNEDSTKPLEHHPKAKSRKAG